MHPTNRPDKADAPEAPWRVTGDLKGVFDGLDKEIHFQITQPEAVLNQAESGNTAAHGNGDGVTIIFKLKQANTWQIVNKTHLDAINHPEQRHWHRIKIAVPADAQHIRVKVNAGPDGNTLASDTVWIHVEKIIPVGAWYLAPPIRFAYLLVGLSSAGFITLALLVGVFTALHRSGIFKTGTNIPPSRAKYPIWQSSLFCVAIMLPLLVWVIVDKSPFGGDQSDYARASLTLYSLVGTPGSWLHEMLHVLGNKAPGITWLGQWFIPIGYYLNSINLSLLLSIVLTQFITLMLIYHALSKLTNGNVLAAMLGCLVVISAPLFGYLSHHYLVEPLQTLVVAWFILIMSYAPSWSRAFTLSQLAVASTAAMLAKTSTPLYCLLPGLIGLNATFSLKPTPELWGWREPRTLITLSLALPLALATFGWYYLNFSLVSAHVSAASSGPIAAVWGKEDVFLNSFRFWLGSLEQHFFLAETFQLIILIVTLGLICYLINAEQRLKYLSLCSLTAILQVILVLAVFSLNANREGRYMLALLPYFAVLAAWGVAQINHKGAAILAVGLLSVQWLAISTEMLGIAHLPTNTDRYFVTVDTQGKNNEILQQVVNITCKKNVIDPHSSIIAIDLGLWGDWLAPFPATYVAMRDRGIKEASYCQYRYLGDGFFGNTAINTWNNILSNKPHYIVTVDPTLYPPSETTVNQSLKPGNFAFILEKIRSSGLFEEQRPISVEKGILVFRAIAADTYSDTSPESR